MKLIRSDGKSSIYFNPKAAIFLLVAALLLSPIGANELLVFGGNYYPEPAALFLLTLLLLVEKNGANHLVEASRRPEFLSVLFLLGLYASASVVAGQISPIGAYSTSRNVLVFVFGFSLVTYFYNLNNASTERALILIRDLAAYTLIFSAIYFVFIYPDGVKRPYSIGAMLLLGYFSVFERNILRKSIYIFGIFFCALQSNYRAFILYVMIILLANLVMAIMQVTSLKRGVLRVNIVSFFALVGLIGVAVALAPITLNLFYAWAQDDPTRYHQLVYKFEQQYLSWRYGAAGSLNDPRELMWAFVLENFEAFILPSGLFDRNSYVLQSAWTSNYIAFIRSSPVRDGGFLFMLITFGGLAVFPVFLWYNFRLAKSMAQIGWREAVLRIIFVVPVAMLLLSMGVMFFVTDVAFYFGSLMAILISPLRTKQLLSKKQT